MAAQSECGGGSSTAVRKGKKSEAVDNARLLCHHKDFGWDFLLRERRSHRGLCRQEKRHNLTLKNHVQNTKSSNNYLLVMR